ncbi:hypothetical protein INT43_004820 [Umbelopsis isabellina]|uniref:Uncharacterized protein n=1 Tax=Mortierella isabellina TaxID=91625 RepID=A0A8H7PEP5_MORIS|nr:hypothetical protein INT43_004820 [Umbelopsis isabellina]
MAAAHASTAQLNNTTVRLAAMTLKERQTASATGLAEASTSNEASSSMNLPGNEESQNELKLAVYELIALATVQRPFVRITVDELFRNSISLVKKPTIQSDASSIIADNLRRLNIAVRGEAKRMASTDHGRTLDVLAAWNALLEKHFSWDEQRNQFLAPLQVMEFLKWLVTNYHQGKELTSRESKMYRVPSGGWQDAINFFVTSELQPKKATDTPTEEQLSQSATLMSPGLSRQSIEHLVTYTSQDDTLDFLWSDEEEGDAFDKEESEDEEFHHSNEIFGSATEISGAEVTDSDWSVLD